MRVSANGETFVVSVLTATVIALASMGLVMSHNRHRADSTAVEWALDALRNLPDATVRQVCDPAEFVTRVELFRDAIRQDRIPIDSVRGFYQAYARQARDGHITVLEARFLGTYLGLARKTPIDATSSEDFPESSAASVPGR